MKLSNAPLQGGGALFKARRLVLPGAETNLLSPSVGDKEKKF